MTFPWTPEIEAEILDRMAKGQEVRDIAKLDHMPGQRAIRNHVWGYGAFGPRYIAAKKAGKLRLI